MWKRGKEITAGGGSSLSQLRSQIDEKYQEFTQQKKSAVLPATQKVSDPAAALDLLKKTRKLKKPIIKEAAADGSIVENAKVQEALKRKAEIYEQLKKKPSAKKYKRLMGSEHTLVDFELKKLESSDEDSNGSDEELIEVEDEFGRHRRVNQEEARRIRGINVNLKDDYKEYSTKQQYGYHMVPPPRAVGGTIEAEREIRVKDEQAKEEWQNVLLRDDDGPGDEHYNPEWELRNLGTGFYKFSKDEDIRRTQMEELKSAHDTTAAERTDIGQTKQDRKKRMQERMAQLRQAREQPSSSSVIKDSDREAEQFLADIL